ncbi:MAG: hypothetical protein IPO31_10965 [Candidatus Obscuribacter sp.]|nr:hypothetical protein [Candidatus Obscuribacter sp.]
MKKVLFSLVSSSRALGVALVKKGLSKKRRQNRAMHRIELSACGKKFLAASLLLLVATPQLTQVRAYAQAFEQPATVATVPQNFSLESASANIQTVAGLGAGAFQGINITSDKLPSGTATDSQSNSQSQAPTVPPAPGMPQLDMVTGLVPVVAGVTLTPDVPVLPTTGPATNSDAANQVTTSISAPTSANSETSSLIGQPAAAVDAGSTTTITAQAAPAADLSDSSTTIMAVSQPVESSSTAAVITQSNQGAELASSTSDSSTVAAISSSDSTSSAPDPGNVTITTAPGDSSSASANNVAPQAAQTTDSTSVASAIAGTSQLTQTPQVTLTTNSLFSSGTSLDLSSNQATFTAPIDQPVFISVGGTIDANGSVTGGSLVQVNPGQMLTASQYIAVTQVVQHGAQNIVLTSSGSAEGGSFTLFAGQTGSLSNLVLPSNVALDTVGFTSSNPFSVTGAASILGSLYALQSTDSTASVLDFGSLTVGGLLTGDMAQMPVLSTIMPGYFSSSGLVLNAFGGLQNYGTISTAGTLTITSNADIGNAGYLSGSSVALNAVSNITNTGNIFASAGNVDLNSVSGNFINSGTTNSALSNVNFNTAQAASIANINLTNAGGSILANNGSINFRTTDFMDKADLKITGGSLSANTVELNGGRGEVEVNVDNLGGTVNSSAYVVKLAAASDITIGNTTANGDPTIVSTTGNVTLAGNQITGGAPLSVIAYGDIITAPGITIQTNGGEVFMASGVNIQDTGATWTITGPASPNGGLLDLRGVTTFSTAGATGGNASP